MNLVLSTGLKGKEPASKMMEDNEEGEEDEGEYVWFSEEDEEDEGEDEEVAHFAF